MGSTRHTYTVVVTRAAATVGSCTLTAILSNTTIVYANMTEGNADQVRFTTIYPGWYIGRITHIHAQIYLNDNLAFPAATTTTVYNSSLYAARGLSIDSGSTDSGFAAWMPINITG